MRISWAYERITAVKQRSAVAKKYPIFDSIRCNVDGYYMFADKITKKKQHTQTFCNFFIDFKSNIYKISHHPLKMTAIKPKSVIRLLRANDRFGVNAK